MARFRNLRTEVVVSVADSKADRYGDGWESADDKPKAPAKKAASKPKK